MFRGFCLLIISVAAILSLWTVLDYTFDTHATTDLLKDFGVAHGMWRSESKPDIQLTNPIADTTTNEPKANTPAPTETPKDPPLISSTTTGAGDEFDGTKTLNRPLTWYEKKLARQARKIALISGWHYAPLEEMDKIGPHAMTVVVKGKEAGEFAGVYYRDEPLEEWEKELARTLLKRAKEGGSEEEK